MGAIAVAKQNGKTDKRRGKASNGHKAFLTQLSDYLGDEAEDRLTKLRGALGMVWMFGDHSQTAMPPEPDMVLAFLRLLGNEVDLALQAVRQAIEAIGAPDRAATILQNKWTEL
jgi:hypothetical protein